MEVSVKMTAALIMSMISFSGVVGGFHIWKQQSATSMKQHSSIYPQEIENINADIKGRSYPIIEADDIYIKKDSVFKALQHVRANDVYAGDITQRVEVYGEVNTAIKGDYQIRYVVRNDFGLKTIKHMKVIVD